MARGKTLLQLTEAVRSECRRSTSASRGIDELGYLHQVIRRHYEAFYDDYDWPHLKVVRDKTIAAGQRYYDFPTDLDFERIKEARYYWGNIWTPVEFGIDDDQYSSWDSDNDERTDPVERWDIIDAGSGEQVEVWPLPASAGTLRFRGIRAKTELVDNADVCDIDDQLVVLAASAEILGGAGQKDADAKLGALQRRLTTLRARSFKRKTITMGGDAMEKREPRQIRIIASNN